MKEQKQDKGQCQSDSCCNTDQAKPSFKRELTLLTAPEADSTCKDGCCSQEPVQAKIKKPFTMLEVKPSSSCEDACCQTENPLESSANPEAGKDTNPKHEFLVHGMDCSACATTIEKAVKQIAGVSSVRVHYSTGKMQVYSLDDSILEPLQETVKKLGYGLDRLESNAKSRTYRVEGMDCSSCALTIENHLQQFPDVRSVSVNFSSGKMTIDHDNPVDNIVAEVKKIGFEASLLSKRQAREIKPQKSGMNTVILAGIFLLAGFGGSFTGMEPALMTFLYALSIVIGGYKPARSAFYAVQSRSLDMNVLMTVAVIGAVLIGEWFEGATVVWLFSLGNALQTRSIEKTRNSIRSLIDLAPPVALVKKGEQLVETDVEFVSVGQLIVIRPGDKIPLDGEIIDGESSINQAPITGESIPVDKQPGDSVYAGTINEHGSLTIRVTKLAEDTTLAKIIYLVEEAQEQKAPTEAFVDKFARIYTPIVFVFALLVMVLPPLLGFGTWGDWFYRGLELLVVACPCALVISTPVAIVSAIGNAARNGVLIKGGAFLEVAGRISAIAFDKTGTLTEGKPKVTQVIPLEANEKELLSIARTLEAYSTHPIAKAVVAFADQQGIGAKQGDTFKNLVGKGVVASVDDEEYYAGNAKLFRELGADLSAVESRLSTLQEDGHTIVIIGTQHKIAGVIAVADTVRATSAGTLDTLKRTGVKDIVMLTGDNKGTARTVASQTGVTRYFADLLPEDKVEAVKQLQGEGHLVAMVGDGINDAPALATANLGIAMGGAGTDTAMETADIVLMADNLEKLPHTVKLSKKALRIIKQNIWFSLIIKAVALILIFPDILTLWLAVISDTGAALIVILNSMRLLRVRS
ncbi:heavy metal translocating P-type ATPase [Paenibacillus sp. 1P07SE]|uniref:heavy metal translocating P-type ATPase n=1 Tax=Paenibacillus sp. 1P07SE TaxID=3132209 RepID=UPI0039A5EAD4